jgi:hypothetical protein
MQGQFDCCFAETPIIRTKVCARDTNAAVSRNSKKQRVVGKSASDYGGAVGVSKHQKIYETNTKTASNHK